MSRNYTAAYWAWRDMKKRCLLPQNKYYYNYGGRGIKVCKRWLKSYDYFLADIGESPGKGYSLDRKDNNADYKPSNCRWATKLEQDNNRRTNTFIEYNGVKQTIAQWARQYNVRADLFRYYYLKSHDVKDAAIRCQ